MQPKEKKYIYEERAKQAKMLADAGFSDADIARIFKVHRSQITQMKKVYSELFKK